MVTIKGPTWKLEHINGVIFDKDGTLIDSHLYWGRIIELRAKMIRKYFKLDGIEEIIIKMKLGWNSSTNKLMERGPIGLLSRAEVIEILIKAFAEDFDITTSVSIIEKLFDGAQLIFETEVPKYTKTLPGVYPLLDSLHKNEIPMALVTSDSYKLTMNILYDLKMQDYFTIVLGRENCNGRKESGIPCKQALDLLSVNPGNTITIGDAPVDIIMAKQNDLLGGIGVTTGQTSEKTLLSLTPYIISNLNELEVIKE